MSRQKLAESLHPLERRVLPFLEKYNSFNDIVESSSMSEVEVMRALQWLQNKGAVKIEQSATQMVFLDENGKKYLSEGLPETRLLKALSKNPLTLNEIPKKTNLSSEEVSISIGTLKSKAAISISKDKEIIISITDQGKLILQKESIEDKFLRKIFPAELSSLKAEEKFAFDNLIKRKNIIKTDNAKSIRAYLTGIGKELIKSKIDEALLERLTPALIKSGSWKDNKFRRYEIKSITPKILGGRKQHYRLFLDEIRRKFLSLGFTEMFGPVVESDFWDMDALFMPQFHSARDIHQGYYIKEPKHAKDIPKNILENVKNSHENGFGTGGTGWQYKFDVQRTHRNILRTHDTSITARTLASKDLKIPGKYFQIARCFRYDVIDATHLSDFNQVGGFVIDEDIDFRHLKGLLKMFAEEFAETDKIKITPSYFPFTEPSAQLHAKHPKLGWVELAGSGIFRPEMVKALIGKEVPVIAWGIGLDRLAMFNLGINDIRQLFSHDLEFLRNVKII